MPMDLTAAIEAAREAGRRYERDRYSAWWGARQKGRSGDLALERVRPPRYTRPECLAAFAEGRREQAAALRD